MYINHSGDNPNSFYEKSGYDLNQILSNIKPLEGKIIFSGDPVDKEFYQENEWRFVPRGGDTIPAWLAKEVFDDAKQLDSYNTLTKENYSLKVSPKDIKYIFVKRDSDIPEIINFVQTDMDSFSGSDLKILMSRVVSLDSLIDDL